MGYAPAVALYRSGSEIQPTGLALATNSCRTAGLGCAQRTLHAQHRHGNRKRRRGHHARWASRLRSRRLHNDARRLHARTAGTCRRTAEPAAFSYTSMRRGRLQQCRWQMGNGQGPLWDLQCKLRVGVIWGRRHFRVALEISSEELGMWHVKNTALGSGAMPWICLCTPMQVQCALDSTFF